jgi:hypothetical protein
MKVVRLPTPNQVSQAFAWKSMSNEEGSCNACTRWTTQDGVVKHKVTVIDGRGCSIRFCDYCLLKLKTILNSLPE